MAQRQWRSDDTDQWQYGFGNGSDGNFTVSSDTTDAPIDSSCSGTAGEYLLSATNTSFKSGQIILIHQTRGSNAGAWELNKIASYTAGTITLQHPLINTYTDGSGVNQAQVLVARQYQKINVLATLTTKSWNGDTGGICFLLAKSDITISGGITATGAGFRGGTIAAGSASTNGKQGESNSAVGSNSTSANGSGGGGGTYGVNGNRSGAGGGGGGYGTAGTKGNNNDKNQTAGGTGGGTVGNAALTTLFFGGAGGSGGGFNLSITYGGPGGNSGGIIFLCAPTINVTGTISCNGVDGGAAYGETGGGGGGAGGSILLKCVSASLGNNLVVATNGAGGARGGDGGRGREGGVGRIHIDYSGQFTGTTSPTINASLDKTIIQPAVTLLTYSLGSRRDRDSRYVTVENTVGLSLAT